MTDSETLRVHKPMLWLVAAAVFMQMLDTTIVNTALPSMAADLGQSPLRMQAVVVAYALTVATLAARGAGGSRNMMTIVAMQMAVGAAARFAWGFAGVFRSGDWHSLSTDQAAHRLFGAGSAWFQRSGWPLLDGAANVVLTLDLFWTLAALCAAVLHGFVFWAGVAARRRATRARSH